jgi:3-oxoacyl-[acyl-carrier protein] reductase
MLSIVVTGGTRGLGLGITRRVAAAGYRVIVIARHGSEELAAVPRDLGLGADAPLHFWPFDLANLREIPDLVKGIHKEFGPIHGLVNNAALGTSGVLASMRDTDIERLVRLNTISPLILTKYVVRSMMAGQGGGRIVNIASIVSFTGYSGLSVYGATKASIVGFTRSLSRELGPLGVTVNAVAPGFVDTAMTGGLDPAQREQIVRRSALRRLADIEDVANAVEFLLSDKAKNVTGTVLTVDAGATA